MTMTVNGKKRARVGVNATPRGGRAGHPVELVAPAQRFRWSVSATADGPVRRGGSQTVDAERIREISERNARSLTCKASRGRLTGVTRARIESGLRCVVEDGPWRLETDLPAKAGGEDSAPTPGTLGRGALASCLAMGIIIWAARLGVPVDAVEVEVQADFDARGELGVGDVAAGYQEIRRVVAIDSPAAEAVLLDLLDTAERHSPYLDAFVRAQSMRRVVKLNGTEV